MLFNVAYKNYLYKIKKYDPEAIEPIFAAAEKDNLPLYDALAEQGYYGEEESYHDLAEYLHIEYRVVQINELNFGLIEKFPLEKLVQFQAVPYDEHEGTIRIGLPSPMYFNDIMAFKGLVHENISLFLISKDNAKQLIQYVSNKAVQATAIADSGVKVEEEEEEETDISSTDAPVVKLCDSILREAVDLGASDIHIEPYESEVRVRYRIDGTLMEMSPIKRGAIAAVVARYKIMAGMNIAERRVPQDGKIKLVVNEIPYDFRVSSLPTIFGEKVVIRIYNNNFNTADFKTLGFDERQEALVQRAITRPHGIILMTGPTGSGKSTTLYSFLRYLNTSDRNIITVEDPVENQIYGINQVQVNPRADMTFSNALRAILRQDPNVIMIGEIRDEETAQIATRAAITGHLVLSTIHTNDAVSVIARLKNMGIAPYLISDALLCAISQRLVKRLCDHCKEETELTSAQEAALDVPHGTKIYKPCGCKFCNNTGYHGRLAIFEILINSPDLRREILVDNSTSEDYEKIATREGKVPMLIEARAKVLQGLTSYSEFERLSDVVEKAPKA